ncbi:tripartite tricarboxylate transporter substrate binding protein [Starkeya koreensis]|uniref:Tripartite tricarboxylate transporter substrate binding protein n=1 Tax=Ancylobacter koreensis TaxID=266121 RepID=A0ABT0DGP2_9HYPH|nr:tripartite tricarboxylate transporter substrate binding protein [Ancylobacter koreensis]MCK0206451.1 tripartite tricarboxylate transporter substrate binding protein [Ancylobacter koreensis]
MLKLKALVLPLLIALAAPAAAQSDYPTKPIRVVLPFPPGGGTDAVARLIGDGMSKRLGQQVLIDNRPGAGGNIASDLVARAAPDGYTLLMGFSTALTVTPGVSPNLTFNVAKDFTPITELAAGQYVLVVHPDVPVKNIDELIAYAKKNPGSLNFGSSGTGSPHHLAAELFMAKTGTKLTHLAYKGASGSTTALLGNEIQLVFGSVTATLPHIQVGKMRPLATSGLKRLPALPDIPTLDESGLKGFDVTTWYGLLAPAGTSQAIVDKLHDTAVAVLNEEKTKETLNSLSLEPIGNTGPEFGALIARETASWAKVINEAGIKLE